MDERSQICDLASLAWRDLLARNHLDDPDRPVLALEESSDRYRLRSHSPEIVAEHLRVETELHALRIEGTLRCAAPPWDLLAPLRDAPTAHFARVFRLSCAIDPACSTVSLERGILEITLMKQQSDRRPAMAC
jgi:HSP20 family molecular chaperone IbpA